MSVDSVGARLKKLRLEKGLSLDEVNKKTKIHLKILKSIEEDNLINLNPIYVKGFIKIYCRLLGADPRSFLPDLKETKAFAQIKVKEETKSDSLFKNVSARLINLGPHIKVKPVLATIGIIIGIVLFFNFAKAVFYRLRVNVPKKKLATQIVFEKNTKKHEIPKQGKAQSVVLVPVAATIRLGIRAKENCYINLKADTKAVFQGVLKKGRFESWQAKDRFELSVGNAGAVDLEINGKLISNLGKKNQVLKKILINREGLSIAR